MEQDPKEILSEPMQRIMKENDERNRAEEERRNETYKKEMWNYFHGKPIGEGLPEGYNPEKQYKELEKHFNNALNYDQKIKKSVSFDMYGKYYIHPKTESKVYFTHDSELPTLDNEYPENDTIQPEGVKIPQPSRQLTEEEREQFAPRKISENGIQNKELTFTIPDPETMPDPELKDIKGESIKEYVKALATKELSKIYYKKTL